MTTCREIPALVKIGNKNGELYMKNEINPFVAGDIKSL